MHDWFDAVKQYFAVFDIFSKKNYTSGARCDKIKLNAIPR